MNIPFGDKPKTPLTELDILRSNNERMRDLLDRRPSLNAGLYEAYVRWNSLCYTSDAAFAGYGQSEIH